VRLRALVLDRAHRVLTGLPAVEGEGPRPLHDLKAALGLELPSPAGVRRHAAGMDFAFVLPSLPHATPMMSASADDTIWELYCELLLGGYRPPSRAVDVFFFGAEPEMAARLVHLVTCGQKRGTAGWVRAARQEGLTIPTPGLVSVVTDGYGLPRAVIQTQACRHVALADVDAELAASEGEGDLTLADWREGHLAYFEQEAARLGLAFDEREVLMIELFRVLHVVGRAD
jgi:uncharacterized protein YhfF